MLVFHDLRLVYLAAPKTGSTAFEESFGRFADNHASNVLSKHARYARFRRTFPELARDYEVITVLREPLDTLYSWYRYRARAPLWGDAHSTHDLSFAEFFDEWCKEAPRPFADVNASVDFVRDRKGVQFDGLKVIAYEDTAELFALIARRLGVRATNRRRNVSPREAGQGRLAWLWHRYGFGASARPDPALGQRLEDLKAGLALDHPKFVAALEAYRQIRLTPVSALNQSPARAPAGRG